jgi:REP element-mobilizing transposase RayT
MTRVVVESAIREVCEYRNYGLLAVNARTNHVHSVVTAACKPEHMMDTFKAYATRRLREAGLLDPHIKPWARHGSTPYLWTEEAVENPSIMSSMGKGTIRSSYDEALSIPELALPHGRASDTKKRRAVARL